MLTALPADASAHDGGKVGPTRQGTCTLPYRLIEVTKACN